MDVAKKILELRQYCATLRSQHDKALLRHRKELNDLRELIDQKTKDFDSAREGAQAQLSKVERELAQAESEVVTTIELSSVELDKLIRLMKTEERWLEKPSSLHDRLIGLRERLFDPDAPDSDLPAK